MSRLLRQESPALRTTTSRNDGVVRVALLRIGLLLVALLLMGRLFILQIHDGAKWTALAETQHNLSRELHAERGTILLHDGGALYPIAVNREYKMVYVVPREISDTAKTALELGAVLNMDVGEIQARIEKRRDDPFELIKKKLNDDEVASIQVLKLLGVYLLPEIYRYYPANELASKVVGFVGPGDDGDIGIYGLEASLNSTLHGIDGKLSQEQDAAGRWIPFTDREHVAATEGTSVVLTLDRVIQYEVEKILADGLTKYQADRISAIVMEPKTGHVLAMAALPQFNPNAYGQVTDLSLFFNANVSLPYEPGSVMKPLTMAAGIEEGKVNPHTEFIDTGAVSEGGYTIRNSQDKVYGKSSMIKVLDESINTGAIFVEKLIGNDAFRDYLERFGFGTRTGIQLPAEHPGSLRNLINPKATLQFFTAAFGQGVTVTPIQLVAAYGALANGGVLMRPQVVERYRYPDGHEEMVAPREIRRVVSEETARTLGTMLRDVVENGHGKRADVPGYLVGGKTGTAQVAKQGGGGYEESLTIGSFIGYAPLNDPRFVVLVKVDNPKDVEWAESSAAPTFGSIMQFLLNYAKVQPTETLKTK